MTDAYEQLKAALAKSRQISTSTTVQEQPPPPAVVIPIPNPGEVMTPEIAEPIPQQEGDALATKGPGNANPDEPAEDEQGEYGNCCTCSEALEEDGTCPNTCGQLLEDGESTCQEHVDENGWCPICDADQEPDEGTSQQFEYTTDPQDPNKRIYTPEALEERRMLHEKQMATWNLDILDLMGDPRAECDLSGMESVVYPEELEAKPVPTLEVEIDQSLIRNVLNAVQLIAEEATFEADSQGIRLRTMDPSHVALIDLCIEPTACKNYSIEGSRKFTLRVEDFQKDLKRAEKYDLVRLRLQKLDELELELKGATRRKYTEPLLESYRSDTPLPKLIFDAMFCISKEVFDKVLKNIGAKSNHITIDTTLPNSVLFSGKGDTGKAEEEVDKQMLVVHQVQIGSKATYSLEYLMKMMKAVKCSTVKIEYSSKMPLRIWMQLGPAEDAWMNFYLAPRVTE